MAWRSSGMPELGVYFVKPGVQRVDGRGLDVLGRVEIGLAGGEAAYVDALGLHGLGFAVDGKGQRGSEAGGAGRDGHKNERWDAKGC